MNNNTVDLTVYREFNFQAAHSLPKELSEKCWNLHGHEYRGRFFVQGPLVEGMVIEGGLLKKCIEDVVDTYDHAFLVGENSGDQAALASYLKRKGYKTKEIGQHTTVEIIGPCLVAEVAEKVGHNLPGHAGMVYTIWAEIRETEKFGCIVPPVTIIL